MAEVTKEVDAWLNGVAKLLKEHVVEGDAGKGLQEGVVWVLDKIGKDKLQQMDAAAVLVAVRDELPNAPKSLLVMRAEDFSENSGLVTKLVEEYFSKNKILSAGWKTFGDGKVNELEAQIAKYIAALPSDVKIKRDGMTIVLSKEGVAAKLEGDGWSISADAQPAGAKTKLNLDTKALKLNIETQGQAVSFDAKLKVLNDKLKVIAELESRVGTLADPSQKAAVQAKLDASYGKLKLQVATSLKELDAKLAYISEDPGLKELSVKLKSDYDKVKAEFSLFFKKKDATIALKAVAEADKLEVELNAKLMTAGGLKIEAEIQAALDKVQANLQILKKTQGVDAKFLAKIETQGKGLTATGSAAIKSTGKTRVELVAKFQATLEDFKATLEAAVESESWRVALSGSVSSSGAASGQIAAYAKLSDGIQIMGHSPYVKVGAEIDDKRWSVFVGISLTSPPKAADVKKLIQSVEGNVQRTYDEFNKPGGGDSQKILADAGKQFAAPYPKVGLEAGFFLSDDFPKAGIPDLPMTGGFGLKLTFP